ncbi:MAG TPA: hypothetical protein VK211_23825 [Kamptonema sp.]|nr:hypothetical protein [Kamptonema sp.]
MIHFVAAGGMPREVTETLELVTSYSDAITVYVKAFAAKILAVLIYSAVFLLVLRKS